MTFSLSRRSMLRLLGYGAAAQGLVRAGVAQGVGPRPFVLVLKDLPPALSETVLEQFLAPLAAEFLRLGLAVPGPGMPGLTRKTLGVLTQAEAQAPGLVELLAEVPRARRSAGLPYSLARSLSEDMKGFAAMFPEPPAALPVTLFTRADEAEAENWSQGARSLGIRSVFDAGPETEPTLLSPRGNNVWHVQGGMAWHWQDGAEVWSKELNQALPGSEVVFAHLSLAGLAAHPPETIAAAAEALAGVFAEAKQAGLLVSVLPRELSFRHLSGSYDQSVLLLIDESSPRGDAKANAMIFREALEAAGIPAMPVLAAGEGASGATLTCTFAEGVETAPFASCRLVLEPAQPEEGGDAMPPSVAFVGPGVLVGPGGPDENGTLTIPLEAEIPDAAAGAALFDDFADVQASLRDKVFLIRPDALRWPSSRALLLDAILRLKSSKRAVFKTARGFIETVFPDFNLLDRLHRKAATLTRPELAPGGAAAIDDTMLDWDARTALAYFQRSADPITGLSAPTEFSTDVYATRYETITMWDLASNIFGVLSAMELGLVEEEEGEAWIAKIIASIPTREMLGLSLPVAEFNFQGWQVNSRDFNACDAGRLLIALKAAAQATALGPEIDALVAGWDIAASLREGKPINITKGRVSDASQSHCAHYFVRGCALWGIEVSPAFGTDPADEAFERQMRVMDAATVYGPVGVEPYGLEIIELGMSVPAQILGDVLLAAQYETFAESGELVAVSETPLDHAPWFTYQGLDLRNPARPWKVRPNPPDPRYEGDEAQDELRVFSAKAAYLTAATRPSQFTNRLLAVARARCAIPEQGFFVGSYSASGTVMNGYSDINTNGIILEALAYVARGRRPMLKL